MITRLKIRDFQSIHELEVDCGPITVFVGESDSGKSAIVRALRGAAFNDYPSDHVRSGAAHSEVLLSIVADDGWAAVRVRKGKAVNEYTLVHHDNEDGQVWRRVGRDVPPEVTAALGWRAVTLDDGTRHEPNFQLQFDPPFLLGDSPIRVAKTLGSLTNVALLFSAIRQGANEEREMRRAVEESHARAQDIAERVDRERPEHEKLQRQLDRVQAASSAARKLLDDRDRFAGLVERAHRLGAARRQHLATIQDLEARTVTLEGIPELIARRDELRELGRRASGLAVERSKLQGQVTVLTQDLATAEQELFLFEQEHEVCPLCGQRWAERSEDHG